MVHHGDVYLEIEQFFGMSNIVYIFSNSHSRKKIFVNVNDFFKNIIIVGNNIKRSRYDNGIILMSIYDFLLDSNSLEY